MNNLKTICIVAASLLLAGCSEDEKKHTTFDNPTWKVDLSGYTDIPQWKVDQMNDLQQPDWQIDMMQNQEMPSYTLPDNNVMPASMTAVIRLTPFLETHYEATDKVLAFIDGECRGEGIFKLIDGIPLCYIQIKAPADETDQVSFLYYSSKNRAAYQASLSLSFEMNGIYGTADYPEYPDFENGGKYPASMQAVICLPDDLPGAFDEADMVAAFVGNECRGVASRKENKTFEVEIRGTGEPEELIFKYYSQSNKNIYKSEEAFMLSDKSVLGSAALPQMLSLIPQKNMRAVVRLSDELRKYENISLDQVGAFVGNECRAIGEPFTINDESYYVMQIHGGEGVAEKISFRYYSANNSYLYQTDGNLSFLANGNYGTEQDPEILAVDLSGKFPLKMNAYLALPANLHGYAGENDKIGAFVGDECRGTSLLEWRNGVPCFSMEIIGKITVEEEFVLRYYNCRNKYLYETSAYFAFDHNSELGTENEPLCLTLINVQ